MQIHLIRKHSVRSDKNMGKEYECKECEKVYTTRANLTLHERTHSGKFECVHNNHVLMNLISSAGNHF